MKCFAFLAPKYCILNTSINSFAHSAEKGIQRKPRGVEECTIGHLILSETGRPGQTEISAGV